MSLSLHSASSFSKDHRLQDCFLFISIIFTNLHLPLFCPMKISCKLQGQLLASASKYFFYLLLYFDFEVNSFETIH